MSCDALLCKHVAYQYFIGDVSVCPVNSIRDLGIIFDDQLRFDKQASAVSRKANYGLLCVKRAFRRFNLRSFTTLYKTMVRPVVEYCSSVWYPTRKSDSLLIEKVQRRASKFVPYLKYLPYERRLSSLSLPSLQFRRDRMDLVNTFCIIKGIDHVSWEDFFEFGHYPSTRQNSLKLYQPRVSRKVGQSSFVNRSVKSWNMLPNQVVLVNDVTAFKTALVETSFYERQYLGP